MFEVIESADKPLNLLVLHNQNIKSGDIVEIGESGNKIGCVLSDGSNPFGIVLNTYYHLFYSGESLFFAQVLNQRTIFRTDIYDKKSRAGYKSGTPLYVRSSGILTSFPIPNVHCVAKIISVFNDGCVEAVWL